MEAISELAIKYGFAVLEDASHTIGGSYKDEPVGNYKVAKLLYLAFIRSNNNDWRGWLSYNE